ncbi:phage tail protein, partial [Morganella morganii]|nr:phage tail protein [Morganella morganii]
MITFDNIPDSLRKPGKYLEFNLRMATRALPGNPQVMLIVAPMMKSGLAEPLTPVNVFDDTEAAVAFGAGSLAHIMAKAAITANSYLQLQVIGVEENPAGKAAAGTLTVTGPATNSGTFYLTVCGERLNVAVTAGDSADDICQAISDTVNAQMALPVKAALTTGESDNKFITLTARQTGEYGNDILLSASCTAKGITQTLTAMQGGENNADIQPALDAVFAAGHNIIVPPFSDKDTLLKLRTHLEKTGGPLEQRGAVAAAGWTGTLSTGTTLAADINDGRTTIAWYP